MLPNAAVNEGIGGAWIRSVEYCGPLEGEASLELGTESQFKMEDFRPVKALGSGDMGSVYLVAEHSNNAPYAMKVMRKDVLRARKNEHRAQAERDILASVSHPFLPVLHSHFENDKHFFLITNYCHGGDLNILRHMQPEKRLSENASRFYIAEVLLALEYLHKRNIVYRDLKPENILIRSDGHIMLTDFDLSLDLTGRNWTKPSAQSKERSSVPREKKSSRVSPMKAFFARGIPVAFSKKPSKKSPNARVTPEDMYNNEKRGSRTGQAVDGPANSFVGTEEYIAPEIIRGRGHGLPVDWWTLGILIFELLYGKTPFKGLNRNDTFYRILSMPVTFPGVPNNLTDLMSKLLVKEPDNRLGTKGGAEEIKKHPFFAGVNWNELEYMSTTPVVPDPFSWEQIEEGMAAKAKASGKEVQGKWSFCKTVESPIERDDNNNRVKSSGPLSLKSNNPSYQDRLAKSLIAKSLVTTVDSSPVPPPQDYSPDEDCSGKDTFSMESQSDLRKQLSSMALEEEVRLAPADDVLIDEKLFGDVF